MKLLVSIISQNTTQTSTMLKSWYMLDPSKREKFTDDVDDDALEPSDSRRADAYLTNANPTRIDQLSEEAASMGNRYLLYATGDAKPTIPDRDDKEFHFENGECMAFLEHSVGQTALVWQMVVIPRFEDDGVSRPLRWFFDLEDYHVPLLWRMRRAALRYVFMNRKFFTARYASRCPDIERWLHPSNIRIGFQTVPNVAYLSMHVLIGPLTELGASSGNIWVSFEKVVEYLSKQKDMNVLLNSYNV